MSNKQITPEELAALQKSVGEYEQASFNVGQFTLEIENMKKERRVWLEKAEQALTLRERLQADLQEKYGLGRLNVNTGEITNEQDN
jgi:D-Tyr-tRNAtyr deacylase